MVLIDKHERTFVKEVVYASDFFSVDEKKA